MIGGRKSSTQQKTTNVTTTTTTNIRDIGLTGANAVEALAILESGAIAREELGTMRLAAAGDVFTKALNAQRDTSERALDIAAAATGEAKDTFADIAKFTAAGVLAALVITQVGMKA